MKIFLATALIFVIAFNGTAQTVPDFTVTDSDGLVHNLYADHLDQGQTVVIKLFFTSCPPCISLAPWMEEKYQNWGAGEHDVEFIELSIQAFDSNADVAQYKVTHGLTFPSVGNDGGGRAAAMIYQSGEFGPYFGTPTLAVIAPDGTVTMGFSYDDFDATVAATGATGTSGGGGGGGGGTEPTTVTLSAISSSTTTMPEQIRYILKPANADDPQYDILELTGGSLNFEYPSASFPAIENPVVVLEADGDILNNSINVLDLLVMRKHILLLDPLDDPDLILAADVNNDNKVNALDLLNLQRALLLLIDEFPNDTPSWRVIPAQIPLEESPGSEVGVAFRVVKTGNLN